jgi:hypothetical protein
MLETMSGNKIGWAVGKEIKQGEKTPDGEEDSIVMEEKHNERGSKRRKY